MRVFAGLRFNPSPLRISRNHAGACPARLLPHVFREADSAERADEIPADIDLPPAAAEAC